jgi:hypothetical protein
MKRIITIESESEELINRFADEVDKLLEKKVYDNEVELAHFCED